MKNFFNKLKKSIKSAISRSTGMLKFTMLTVIAAPFNFMNPRLERSRRNAKNQMLGKKQTTVKGRASTKPLTPEAEILQEIHGLDKAYGKGHGRAILNRIAAKHGIDPSREQTDIIKQLANKKMPNGQKVSFTQEVFDDIRDNGEKYSQDPTPTPQPKAAEAVKEVEAKAAKEAEAKARKAAKAEARRAAIAKGKQMKKELKRKNPGMSGKQAAKKIHKQKVAGQSSGHVR